MKVTSTSPVAVSRTVAVGSMPAKVAPASSGLAVTTILVMPAGTAVVSMVMASGVPPEAGRWVTPGPSGALKNTKSASERTFPASVSSRPETSSALGAVTSTVTRAAVSGALPPWVRTVDTNSSSDAVARPWGPALGCRAEWYPQ